MNNIKPINHITLDIIREGPKSISLILFLEKINGLIDIVNILINQNNVENVDTTKKGETKNE